MHRLPVLAAVAVLLSACIYEVPISKKAEGKIPPDVVGYWREVDEDTSQPANRMVVAPLSDSELLVAYPLGNDGMFFRAWPVKAGDLSLVQLEWLGGAKPEVVPDGPRFVLLTFEVTDNALTVRTLNQNVIPKTLTTAEEIRAAIAEHADDPALFTDSVVFQRIATKN